MLRRILALAAIAGTALVAASCGGSAASTENTNPLTQRDLLNLVGRNHAVPGYRVHVTMEFKTNSFDGVFDISGLWDARSGRERLLEHIPAFLGLGTIDVVSAVRPRPALYGHIRDLPVASSDPMKKGWLRITGPQARSFVSSLPIVCKGSHYSEMGAALSDLIGLAVHGTYDGPSQVNGVWTTRYLLRIPLMSLRQSSLFARAPGAFVPAQVWAGPHGDVYETQIGPFATRTRKGVLMKTTLTVVFSEFGRKQAPRLPSRARIVPLTPARQQLANWIESD